MDRGWILRIFHVTVFLDLKKNQCNIQHAFRKSTLTVYLLFKNHFQITKNNKKTIKCKLVDKCIHALNLPEYLMRHLLEDFLQWLTDTLLICPKMLKKKQIM